MNTAFLLMAQYDGQAPAPKTIDGDVGPVIWMNKHTRATLRAMMLALPSGIGI